MNTIDVITRKRDGAVLTPEEIRYMVDGYTAGTIPDYQMSAFLMAVYFQGMNEEETILLTQYMKDSGDTVNLSGIRGIKVDKHSTGGVGDKTTLIAGPAAAACGVPVAKMSGRGLGFTGGTIDKLAAIPGFETSVEEQAFIDQVNEKGIAVIGQTGHIAPADKKIYALRDVTGTVDNLSLITSSVMSKKLASGSDAILLDVKCGYGAFMQTQEEAEKLAHLMVKIGKAHGKKTMAVISDMDQPLGCAIGNALEVKEAIDVLHGKGPADITELSAVLAGMMAFLGEKADTPEEGIAMAREKIADGSALQKFRDMVESQGGDVRVTEDLSLLPQAEAELALKADQDGYIEEINARKMGLASQHTGAGRERKEDEIDLAAGIVLQKKTGDFIQKGDIICKIYGKNTKKLEKALEEAKNAVKISGVPVKCKALVREVIR